MEKWKKIKGFSDYMVSDLGNVKSLKYGKDKPIKQNIGTYGYPQVSLKLNGVSKTKKVHQLVAIAFLGHKPCGMELVVNHKNFIRDDNRVENLEIVTMRENSNKKHLESSSKYTGVYWSGIYKKWIAKISINGKPKHLGYFDKEYLAGQAYEAELFYLNNPE